MPDHAIVIGIDSYKQSKWSLSAAVRDAVNFARWVTEENAGRATEQTLTLLLSPKTGKAPAGLSWRSATRDAIHKVLDRYARKNAGDQADRLWFFYAGHGVMPPGEGADIPPVLVPEEVEDIDDYLFDNKLELKKYLGPLQLAKPNTQIYFIDACRGIVQPDDDFTATTRIHFDLSKLSGGTGAVSQQVLLCATTAGQLANEVGLHGLFGKALLEGLAGRGPELKPDPEKLDVVLTFDALAKYTQTRVRQLGERPDKQLPTQEPWVSCLGATGDLPITRFDLDKIPFAELNVYVEPPSALHSGKASIVVWRPLQKRYERANSQGPPLSEPIKWMLPFSTHRIEISAKGFKTSTATIRLLDNEARPIILEPDDSTPLSSSTSKSGPETRSNTLGARSRGLEALGKLCGTVLSRGTEIYRRLPFPWLKYRLPETGNLPEKISSTGTLRISGQDPLARIEVFNQHDARVVTGWGQLDLENMPPGPYRIGISLLGEPSHSETVFLMAGEKTKVGPGPVQPIPKRLVQPLHNLGFKPSGHQSQPSELFGRSVTTTHIGSVLAWAAYASRFPPSSYGQKLRNLGIKQRTSESMDDCLLQILIGDVRPQWDGSSFTEQCKISVGTAQAEKRIGLLPVPGLPGLARQWTGPMQAGNTSIRIAGPGLKPTSLTLTSLPGYVTVIIVAREQNGGIEMHRYLNPIDPPKQGHIDFSDDIRRSEQNWRALEDRVPLLPGEAEKLIHRVPVDPLTMAVLGYRLHHEDQLSLFEEAPVGNESVWARLRKQARALPDVHILAALAAGEENAAAYNGNLQKAAKSGVPMVADGYEVLSDWLVKKSIRENLPPPIPNRPRTPGGVWTAFDARDNQSISGGLRAIPVERLGAGGPPWVERIRYAIEATARIESTSSTQPFMASGFLVTSELLATMEFCVSSLNAPTSADGERMFQDLSATFDKSRHRSGNMMRVLTQSRVGNISGQATLPVILVEVDLTEKPEPASLIWVAPEVGQRIAVVGHPLSDGRISEGAIADVFSGIPAGEKTVMPGIVVEVDSSSFVYECWTLSGAAGGPVVDLDTGSVLGIHYGGKFEKTTGIKYGMGVPLSLLADDPMWFLAGIRPLSNSI